jgi:hypothetical protein
MDNLQNNLTDREKTTEKYGIIISYKISLVRRVLHIFVVFHVLHVLYVLHIL